MDTEPAIDLEDSSQKPKRIAILTRRFWPICGPTELSIGRLAESIHSAGHTVEIFTVCWQKAWPKNLFFRDVPVRRLPKSASGPWSSLRVLRPMSRHLTDFQPDGILAFGVDDETWTAGKSFSDQIPLALRMDANSLAHQPRPKSNTAARHAQVFEMASSILVDCRRTGDELERRHPNCGGKLVVVPDLIEPSDPSQRTLAQKNAARNALSDAHPVLSIETDQPLVVCAAPLVQDGGVMELVRAWSLVLQQFPKARLWILGDGPAGKDIWEEINDRDLVYSVIMPGFFDELSEVLLAADLYVHPPRNSAYDGRFVEALLSGVCCVGGPETQLEGLIEHGQTGLVSDCQQSEHFANMLTDALSQPELRQRLGSAGFLANKDRFDGQKILARYLKPFSTSAEQPLSTVE